MKIQSRHMVSIIIFTMTSFFIGCNESGHIDEIDNEPINQTEKCTKRYPPLDTVITSHTAFTRTNYPARIKVFQADTIEAGDVVMLGNSLTEQGGNWSSRLGQPNVKNRGIAGDNTDGVLARLNELICGKPSTIFVMIGTNDLFISYSAERVAANIKAIGAILAQELPTSKVIVQTIMPLAAGNDKKAKLLAINELLRSDEDPAYILLDTYQHMANEAGDLPETFTHDGVHLTSDGYAKWIELLKNE